MKSQLTRKLGLVQLFFFFLFLEDSVKIFLLELIKVDPAPDLCENEKDDRRKSVTEYR